MTEGKTVGGGAAVASGDDDLCQHGRSIDQREIAARRGMSEAALVGAQVGTHAVRLRTDWPLTLHRLGAVGPVIALTGGDHATIESVAVYRNIATRGPAAQVSDGDTDLCLFLSEWHTGFAFTEEGRPGRGRSLQFFDARGRAVHKIFCRDDSDLRAFDELVERQASENQSAAPEEPVEPGESPSSRIPSSGSISDSNSGARDESLPVIHDINIEQAHRFAGPMWSQRVATASVRQVLETAIVSKVPLMVMVGNHGAIQIHAGPVRRLQHVEGWLAVLDAQFNLHIDEAGVASAWVVRKSTSDGAVTSLELYDRAGEMVVYLARL